MLIGCLCNAAPAVAWLVATVLLPACSQMVAQTKSRDQFAATVAEPDLRYLPGSHVLADRVAASLKRSMLTVEQFHGTTFPHAPKVFVCKTDASVRIAAKSAF